jgi:malate synthase
VLIETLPAAFEMHEILYELRRHSAGLNCGRWDYLFSVIKTFRNDPSWVLPDRASVTMSSHFMRSYSRLLIQTCHRRGAHAMGGMAAYIPIRTDAEANARALEHVRADKIREATDGHDGTWVAHPGLVPVARAVFDASMPRAHQIDAPCRDSTPITAADLLVPPVGRCTRAGLITNVHVAMDYFEAFLGGAGCVPLNHLMEDAATAEISRAQVWQWRRHGVVLDDGTQVSAPLIRTLLREAAGERDVPALRLAALELLEDLLLSPDLADFATLSAYGRL